MAALRIFARSALAAIRPSPVTGNLEKNAFPIVDQLQKRWAATVTLRGFGREQLKTTLELPDFEVSRDPNEWKYVEWALRTELIPSPPTDTWDFPSGWKPQKASAKELPFFVERTKSHMVPVYLKRTQRGTRRVTFVRRVQGDIAQLEEQLREYVEKKVRRPIGSQINEPAGLIKFRGDYVNHCKNFLLSKGF